MIIAVVGMAGSGKSVCIEELRTRNIPIVYFGGQVMKELQRRGLAVNESNERIVREELRSEHGMAAMAHLSLTEIREHMAAGEHVAIDGLYSYAEYQLLKNAFQDALVIVAIVVDKHERYARLEVRDHRPLTHDEVLSRDQSEIDTLDKAEPIALADYFVLNNEPIEAYRHNINILLHKLLES